MKEDLEEILDIYSKITRINSLIIFHYDVDELQQAFKSCFVPIDAAGGIVRNSKGEYLFIHRRGKWDLPKGKVDAGESYHNTALREVSEETGLRNLNLVKPLMSTYHTYAYKDGKALKKTYWFDMEFTGSETPVPQQEEDIDEIRWFKPDELEIPFSNTYALVKDLFIYLGIK